MRDYTRPFCTNGTAAPRKPSVRIHKTFFVVGESLTAVSFGVSRVYSQQCGYVLADTQSFRDKMKGIVVVMKELEIDPDAGKAR